MAAFLRPRAIPPKPRVALVAPSGPIAEERLGPAVEGLERAGFRVVRRPDPDARLGFLAASDEHRAAELEGAVRDPSVDLVWCVRGGYGATRILERLDADVFRRARKPFVGYSDATALLLWQLRVAELVGIHGPMLERGEPPRSDELDCLRSLLGGGLPAPLSGCEGEGEAVEGELVGGSLTLLAASLGTPFEVETGGRILLLEEVAEAPYRVDRCLQQLEAAGKLREVRGVGVGQLTRCEGSPEEPAALEVVRDRLRRLGLPFVLGLPFGHGIPNLPWPVGVSARLEPGRGRLVLTEPAVEGA